MFKKLFVEKRIKFEILQSWRNVIYLFGPNKPQAKWTSVVSFFHFLVSYYLFFFLFSSFNVNVKWKLKTNKQAKLTSYIERETNKNSIIKI